LDLLPHIPEGVHPMTVVGWLESPAPDLFLDTEETLSPLGFLGAGGIQFYVVRLLHAAKNKLSKAT
jgi:hypothetical protein